jgi:hypothetical protein
MNDQPPIWVQAVFVVSALTAFYIVTVFVLSQGGV